MSEILRNWAAGLGLPGILVIDGHIHIGEWRHAATFANADEAALESVASMDANGIDACCAQSGGHMFEGMDYRLGNDFLLAVCRRVPDRLIGFACVNPNDARRNILDELGRVYDAGIRAIKLINDYQENYPGDGPNLMAVYEFAARRGMIVFNHAWRENVIEKLSAAFPDTPFIFGHYGGGWQDALLKERPNVYANIWSVAPLGWLDRGIANAGAGKFILGSDGFLNPLSAGIGPVVFAAANDADKRSILGLTMARLLENAGALPAPLRRKLEEHD
jgi:predicted TIM-barrel fold metal-dependent hydrolase